MYLTDIAIRNAKAKKKPYNLSVWMGLYFLVAIARKYFQMNYRFGGKQKTLSIRVSPEVSLREVRARRDEACSLLRMGGGPMKHKMEIHSFEAGALEWLSKKQLVWNRSIHNRFQAA